MLAGALSILAHAEESVDEPQTKTRIHPAEMRPAIAGDRMPSDEGREHPKRLPVAQPDIYEIVQATANGTGINGARLSALRRRKIRRRRGRRGMAASIVAAVTAVRRCRMRRRRGSVRCCGRCGWPSDREGKHIHPPRFMRLVLVLLYHMWRCAVLCRRFLPDTVSPPFLFDNFIV